LKTTNFEMRSGCSFTRQWCFWKHHSKCLGALRRHSNIITREKSSPSPEWWYYCAETNCSQALAVVFRHRLYSSYPLYTLRKVQRL